MDSYHKKRVPTDQNLDLRIFFRNMGVGPTPPPLLRSWKRSKRAQSEDRWFEAQSEGGSLLSFGRHFTHRHSQKEFLGAFESREHALEV